MRNTLFTLICLLFLFGCSTNNGVTTVVPAAPTNLTGTAISGTQINLSWTDNDTNETGYRIQRKTSVGNFTDVGSTGTDVTSFSDLGLTNNTAYTYIVYAYNSAGNSLQYSNEITVTTNNNPQVYSYTAGSNVTDIDGNIYPSIITSCGQTWTTKNLNVSQYRNGDIIPQVTDLAQWANLTTGAWCWFNNDSATYAATFGKLYNWFALNDTRGLAPTGWHVPSDSEWTSLANCLGVDTIAGGKMKEEGLSHWLSPNAGATNSSGFTGLPGGYRTSNGAFEGVGSYGYWWTSTESNLSLAWRSILYFNITNLIKLYTTKSYGCSIRCLKD